MGIYGLFQNQKKEMGLYFLWEKISSPPKSFIPRYSTLFTNYCYWYYKYKTDPNYTKNSDTDDYSDDDSIAGDVEDNEPLYRLKQRFKKNID